MEISRIQEKGKTRAGLSKIILKINLQNNLTWLRHLIYEESYSTGDCTQYLVITYIAKESEKE